MLPLPPARQAPLPPAQVLAIVTLLLALHALTSYLYLPVLPLLRQQYGASAEAAQWTLSALLLGFGVTQIAWGVLADRYGRRPTLLAGLLLFTLASLGCLLAADITVMIAWRVLQGAGVAAAGTCARAILRDLYRPEDGVRILSIAFSWLGAVSLAGPVCAALLVERYGLDAALGMLAVIGAVALAYVAWAMPETAPGSQPGTASLGAWTHILGHPTFRAYTLLTLCTYVGHYLFLAGSSFLLTGFLGMSLFDYGLVLSLSSAVHLGGTMVCRYWLRRHGVPATVGRAALLTLAGGAAMALLALADVHTAWAVIVPQWCYVFAHAVHQSCGQAAVMAPFPAAAGTATALSGTLLPVCAVAAGSLLAGPLGSSPLALPLCMGACALLTATVAWTWVRRDGIVTALS